MAKRTAIYQLITNGVMASTSQINSIVQNIQNFDNLGMEVSWTGTPVGTLTINGCVNNGPSGTLYSATSPIPAANALTFSPVLTQPAGAAGGYIIDLNQYPFPWLQVQYVNSSGSGTLNVWIFQKDLN